MNHLASALKDEKLSHCRVVPKYLYHFFNYMNVAVKCYNTSFFRSFLKCFLSFSADNCHPTPANDLWIHKNDSITHSALHDCSALQQDTKLSQSLCKHHKT